MEKSMLRRVLDLLNHSIFVRTVGSLSCVVGLLCYALSSSFKSLFGEWNTTKIVLYIILSSIISVVVFAAKSRVSVISKLKPHVQFLVLMLTSFYSFFADRSTTGKPDTWSVVSSVAFAFTSLCLSRQIKPGFDVGLFSFFLGCVTVQLMKIRLIFILVAAGFCYPLVVLGSYSESQSENGDSSAEESLEIRIDDANRASFAMGQDKAGQISPTRRMRNVSPSPSPPPSTLSTQDDDDANRASFVMGQDKAGQMNPRRRRRIARSRRSGKGVSSSNDPLLARLPGHDNKSFEKLPKVADTEQFLSDLQKQETGQQRQQVRLEQRQLERLQMERLWLQEQKLQPHHLLQQLERQHLDRLQMERLRLQEKQLLQPHHLLQQHYLLQLESLPLLLEQPSPQEQPPQKKQQHLDRLRLQEKPLQQLHHLRQRHHLLQLESLPQEQQPPPLPQEQQHKPPQEQQPPLTLPRRRRLRRRRLQPAAEAEEATAAAGLCVLEEFLPRPAAYAFEKKD